MIENKKILTLTCLMLNLGIGAPQDVYAWNNNDDDGVYTDGRGNVYEKRGNTIYGNNGVNYTVSGNTITGSDGSHYTTDGHNVYDTDRDKNCHVDRNGKVECFERQFLTLLQGGISQGNI